MGIQSVLAGEDLEWVVEVENQKLNFDVERKGMERAMRMERRSSLRIIDHYFDDASV